MNCDKENSLTNQFDICQRLEDLELVNKNDIEKRNSLKAKVFEDDEIEDVTEDEESVIDSVSSTNRPRFNDFKILKLVGKGTFGQVFLVNHKDEFLAMKAVRKDIALQNFDRVESVMLERDVLNMGSENPFIAELYCTFQTTEHLFFIMEFLGGGELYYHVLESEILDEDAVRFYGIEIACGLQFLHERYIIHRDLKLSNIMFDAEGHCKITDFGMSRRIDKDDGKTRGNCGTFECVAPEVFEGKYYNYSVDWWAFGVILYQMLFKHNPFPGDDLDELYEKIINTTPRFPPWISNEAKNCIKLFLEIDPTKRLGMSTCASGSIRNQPFFMKIDVEKVFNREIKPPFKPVLESRYDTNYFDQRFTKQIPELSSIEPRKLMILDQKVFAGFSLVNKDYKKALISPKKVSDKKIS